MNSTNIKLFRPEYKICIYLVVFVGFLDVQMFLVWAEYVLSAWELKEKTQDLEPLGSPRITVLKPLVVFPRCLLRD